MHTLLDAIYNLLCFITEDAVAYKLSTHLPKHLLETMRNCSIELGEYLDNRKEQLRLPRLPGQMIDMNARLKEIEIATVHEVLAETGNNQSAAAKCLGMTQQCFSRRYGTILRKGKSDHETTQQS